MTKMETRVGPAPGGEGLPAGRLCALSQGQEESKVTELCQDTDPSWGSISTRSLSSAHLPEAPTSRYRHWGLAFNL